MFDSPVFTFHSHHTSYFLFVTRLGITNYFKSFLHELVLQELVLDWIRMEESRVYGAKQEMQ